MAQLTRSGKSSGDWGVNELLAFNISIQKVDAATFFGTPQLPATTVSPVILDTVARPPPPAVVTKDERIFFEFLERADIYEKPAVHDFISHILRMVDFDGDERSIATRRELAFEMCGTYVWANPDITVMKGREYLLMVQEERCNLAVDEPITQVVAEAIAAFVENNRLRWSPLAQETIYAITIVGTRPMFYKIPVTQALVDNLVTAQYPAQPTVVQRLVPPVPDPNAYMRHGMNPLVDRRIVFQCLEAMRAMLVSNSKS